MKQMKRLAARLRGLETQLHRRRKQRMLMCDVCGSWPGPYRAGNVHRIVEVHQALFPGHAVKVRRLRYFES